MKKTKHQKDINIYVISISIKTLLVGNYFNIKSYKSQDTRVH